MKTLCIKLGVIGLVVTICFSTIFCCCLTSTAEAEQPVHECHQTTHEDEPSQKTNDCACDRTPAIVKKDIISFHPSDVIHALVHEREAEYTYYFFVQKTAYHGPPILYDTSPLYIKNAVLRI